MSLKINGPNPYLNIYKNNQKKVKTNQDKDVKDDQLKISKEAIQLQKNQQNVSRKQKVSEIKSLVQSGEYKINYEKTAKNLLEFWNK